MLKNIINKNLSGRKVLLLFLLTSLVFSFMLIITIPKVMAFSGGMKLLDMMPMGYDLEYINTLFEALGQNGRDTYLYNQIPVDMIYPFLFGMSYCLLIGYFLKKLDKLNSVLFYLCWLPIIAGIADYMENFGIISMLINYPNLSSNTAILTNVFTLVKSFATTIYFITLIIIMTAIGIKWLKHRQLESINNNSKKKH